MKTQREENFENLFFLFRQLFSCPMPKYFKKRLFKTILGFGNKNCYFYWVLERVKKFLPKKKDLPKDSYHKRKKKNKILKTILNNFENKNEYIKEKFYPMWKISDMRKENIWSDNFNLKKKKKIKKINFFFNFNFFKGKKSFFSNLNFLLNKITYFYNLSKRLVITSVTSSLNFL